MSKLIRSVNHARLFSKLIKFYDKNTKKSVIFEAIIKLGTFFDVYFVGYVQNIT